MNPDPILTADDFIRTGACHKGVYDVIERISKRQRMPAAMPLSALLPFLISDEEHDYAMQAAQLDGSGDGDAYGGAYDYDDSDDDGNGNGNGYGYGYGNGNGDGDGNGYGYSLDFGTGYSYSYGNGSGDGDGYSYGCSNMIGK